MDVSGTNHCVGAIVMVCCLKRRKARTIMSTDSHRHHYTHKKERSVGLIPCFDSKIMQSKMYPSSLRLLTCFAGPTRQAFTINYKNTCILGMYIFFFTDAKTERYLLRNNTITSSLPRESESQTGHVMYGGVILCFPHYWRCVRSVHFFLVAME